MWLDELTIPTRRTIAVDWGIKNRTKPFTFHWANVKYQILLIPHPWGLILTMLNLDISCFENCVDPDQLASEKPADRDQHCFHSACRHMPGDFLPFSRGQISSPFPIENSHLFSQYQLSKKKKKKEKKNLLF